MHYHFTSVYLKLVNIYVGTIPGDRGGGVYIQTVLGMHGQNVDFGNLIHRKLYFWREIFAILKGNSII